MKKTRWIVALSTSLAMLLGVSLVAAGCTDPDPKPEPKPTPTTYTVTYAKGEGEEGTAPEVKSYEAGASVTLAAADTFTKEGYTFTKWLEGTTEYEAGATFTMPEKNVTFNAKWTVAENADPASKTMILGNNKITLTTADVDDMGYLCREIKFEGQANSNYTLKLAIPELGEDVYSMLEVYTAEAYENMDAPLFDADTTEYVFKTDANGLAEFVVFGNYYMADEYDAKLVTGTVSITKGGAYKYAVAFYKDFTMVGQPMCDYKTVQVAENTAIGEEDFPADLEKIGSSFDGWFVAEQVASQYDPEWLAWAPSDVAFTKDTIVTSNLYLLPKWTKAPVAGDGKTELAVGENKIVLGSNDKDDIGYLYREMVLKGNAGDTYTLMLTNSSDGLGVFLSQDDFDNGNAMEEYAPTVVAIPEGGELTIIIDGGYYDADSNYFGTCKISVEEGGEFVWEVRFYYDVNSLFGPYDVAEKADGAALEETDIPAARTTPGYLFAGWYVVGNGELTATKVDVGYEVTDNVTAAGKWIKLPAIKFSNGLTGDDAATVDATASDYTLEEGEDGTELILTLPAAGTFTREGYTLVGWTIEGVSEEDAEEYPCGQQISTEGIEEGTTVTFVAVWEVSE